ADLRLAVQRLISSSIVMLMSVISTHYDLSRISVGHYRLLLEASSVGRACIAYDTGGCDSLIIHNYNGLIVKSNSAQELAVELEYLLKNPQIRLEMGANGRKRVKELFSSILVINKTLQIYKDTIGC
ncbi:glycosyltransferase, partial [Salmonella enterica]|uniref:glycosyltransferase n=1 Tax=Salmonella enterica TaxID=28901 RepID=UPI001F4E5D90